MYSKKLAKNQRVINFVSLLIKGLLFTVQKALSLLPKGASVILNASSTASTVGTPAFSIYSATKAALRSFAHNWILDSKNAKFESMRLVLGGSNPWLQPFGIEQRAGAEICGQSSRHHSAMISRYAR